MNNIKKISYKNILFNKNITDQGGALYETIVEKKENEKIIHINNWLTNKFLDMKN